MSSSSDESEAPKFIADPFDLFEKMVELRHQGLSGYSFLAGMEKWVDAKKVEWEAQERETVEEKEKETSGGGGDARATTEEGSTTTNSRSSPEIPFVALGEHEDSSRPLSTSDRQSSSQARPKKRKRFVLDLDDESAAPKFIMNPFERRAKMKELIRQGLTGNAFYEEMERWIDAKKAEWRVQEREKVREQEKETNGGSSDARATTGEAPRPSLESRLSGHSGLEDSPNSRQT